MAIPQELKGVLTQDPQVMGGAMCFAGTRIPVQILLDNLRASVPLEVFFDAYPDVSREQAQAIINWEDQQARAALGLASGL